MKRMRCDERAHLCRAGIILLLVVAGCDRRQGETPASEPADAYVPGLGEIMSATQMRHLKLWYAGQARNWALADYEVDELEEGFANAMRFHPRHKSAPRPLTEVVPEFMDPPVSALRRAITDKSQDDFRRSYDELTAGCNACHAATGFAFNVVVRPSHNPYANQRYDFIGDTLRP